MTNQIDKAPAGATHRYEHGSDVDWYRQTDRGFYRWQQGSWCASVHKDIQDLANSCPLGRLEAIPAERVQHAEDYLTWLARNVHKFEDGKNHIQWSRDVYFYRDKPQSGISFTRDQWLARRAKLQNKPSWKDAPEWATALTQDSAMEDGLGAWWWHEFAPTECERTWSSQGRAYPAKERGEVLGDWRDTVEQRPVSAGISGSEAAAGLKAFQIKATNTIDWSTAPAGATHHIGGNKLECQWHRVGGPVRYWNGEIWVKRSAFHTLDEAVAKGFAVVARPADLSSAAVIKRLDEATQNVLAAVPGLMDEKFSFEPEHKQVSVSNETVPLEQPVAVAGTGISIVEWAAKRLDDIERKAQEAADLSLRVSTLLRENPGLFSANELADLHQLCDAELTKRDAAFCGGQKYLDAHWFERGELPPVGVSVQWRPGSAGQWEHDSWTDVDVIAHAGDGDIVIKWDGQAGNNKQLVTASQETFRPIRTERDELIDVLKGTHAASLTNLDMLASAILAAGFKRGGDA